MAKRTSVQIQTLKTTNSKATAFCQCHNNGTAFKNVYNAFLSNVNQLLLQSSPS